MRRKGFTLNAYRTNNQLGEDTLIILGKKI